MSRTACKLLYVPHLHVAHGQAVQLQLGAPGVVLVQRRVVHQALELRLQYTTIMCLRMCVRQLPRLSCLLPYLLLSLAPPPQLQIRTATPSILIIKPTNSATCSPQLAPPPPTPTLTCTNAAPPLPLFSCHPKRSTRTITLLGWRKERRRTVSTSASLRSRCSSVWSESTRSWVRTTYERGR